MKRWSEPPSFEIGLERHGVVALHQRVDELVHGDRSLLGIALRKVVTLKKTRKRVAGSELNEAHGPELVAPLGVVAHLGAFKIKHETRLVEIGLGILHDLLVRERRTRGVSADGSPMAAVKSPTRKITVWPRS